jgi:hypothetical protein
MRLGARVGEPRPGEGRMAAVHGRGALARHRVREKEGKRGKKGPLQCSPPRGASAAGGGDGAVVQRQDSSVLELGSEGGSAG